MENLSAVRRKTVIQQKEHELIGISGKSGRGDNLPGDRVEFEEIVACHPIYRVNAPWPARNCCQSETSEPIKRGVVSFRFRICGDCATRLYRLLSNKTPVESRAEIWTPIISYKLGVHNLALRCTFVSLIEQGVRQPKTMVKATKKIVFASKTMLFAPKTMFFATKSILFVTKSILFAPRTMLFATKSIFFVTKTMLFATKSILFATKTIYIATKNIVKIGRFWNPSVFNISR
jgi:hypothetical protein